MRARFLGLSSVAFTAALSAVIPACSPNAKAPQAPAATLTTAPISAAAGSVAPPNADPGAGTATEIQRAALASHGASDAVRELTTEVGPRLAGSPGDAAAVAWALRAMAARGLVNVHAEKVTVPRWERGVETASITAPFPHKLSVTALGGSIATPEGGVEAEVVEVDTLESLAKLGDAAVGGKIVFVNKPMHRAKDGKGYGEAVGVRGRAAIEAASKGALAVVIRSVGTDHNRTPHTGAMRRDKAATRAIAAGALSVPDAELLHRVLEERPHARLKLEIGAKWMPDAESANVVGEVRGTDRDQEIVLIGAHLDSWDLASGAIDDGAGCGVVLEAGRLLAARAARPRRTVRVVLFAAEENSLAGGEAYAKAHAAEAARHVVAIEADSGTDRAYMLRVIGGEGAAARAAAFASRLSALGIGFTEELASGGADISPLRALGVPVMDLEQDMSTYFDLHHTANDTFDKIDASALSQVAAAFATVVESAADMDGDLGRVPEAKRQSRW